MTKQQRRSPCKCGRTDALGQPFVSSRANLKFYATRSGGRLINGIHKTDAKIEVLRGAAISELDLKVENGVARNMETTLMKVRSSLKRTASFSCGDDRGDFKAAKAVARANLGEKIIPELESPKSVFDSAFEILAERAPINMAVDKTRKNSESRSITAMNGEDGLSNDSGVVLINGDSVDQQVSNLKHGQVRLCEELNCLEKCFAVKGLPSEKNLPTSVSFDEELVSLQPATVKREQEPATVKRDTAFVCTNGSSPFMCHDALQDSGVFRWKKKTECERLLDSIDDLRLLHPLKRQCKPPDSRLLGACSDQAKSEARPVGLTVASGEKGSCPTSKMTKKSKSCKKSLGPIEHFLDVYMRTLSCLEQPPKDTSVCCVTENVGEHIIESSSARHVASNEVKNASPYLEKSSETVVECTNSSLPNGKISGKGNVALTHELFDCVDPVERLLGIRDNNSKSELLVLFKDGTSNWISAETVDFHGAMNSVVHAHYCQSERELSCANRLFFKVFGEKAFAASLCSAPESKSVMSAPHRQKIPSVCSTLTSCPVQPPLQPLIKKSQESKPLEVSIFSGALSANHLRIYPSEQFQEVVTKKDNGFAFIFLQHRASKNSDSSRKAGCDELPVTSLRRLISVLEDCMLDTLCKAVVVRGIEDFFSSSAFLSRLLKKSPTSEARKYEEDISVFRTFAQTVRAFTKPIAAMTRKPAQGLAASVLALFDLVMDESENCASAKSLPSSRVFPQENSLAAGGAHRDSKVIRRGRPFGSKNKKTLIAAAAKRHADRRTPSADHTKREPTVVGDLHVAAFPRLMGLANCNEAALMGTGNQECCQNVRSLLAPVIPPLQTFSPGLRVSLKRMKKLGKLGNRKKTYGSHASPFDVGRSKHTLTSVIESGTTAKAAPDRCGSVGDESTCPNERHPRYLESLFVQIERERELALRDLREIENLWKKASWS